MDSTFWTAILISALISIPIGIVINLFSYDLRAWYLRWQGGRQLQSLKKERILFRQVISLHLDPHRATRYFFLLLLAFIVGVATIFFGLLLVVLTLLTSMPWDRVSAWVITPYAAKLTVQIVGLTQCYLGFAFLWLVFTRFTSILRRLNDMNIYLNDLRRRWPGETWEANNSPPE